MYSAAQVIRTRDQAVVINGVLRNTYLLLSATIAVAAASAFVWTQLQLGMMSWWIYLIGFFGLSFIIEKTADSVWGLFWTFVFAAFIGAFLGPIVEYFARVNPTIVVQALSLTAVTFVGLSMYTVVRRADFSWLGQFLTIAFFVVIGLIVISFFVDLSPFQLLISGFMIMVACALILFQTSQVVLGGERNYIRATVTLFVAIYILFINLLSVLSFFGGDD